MKMNDEPCIPGVSKAGFRWHLLRDNGNPCRVSNETTNWWRGEESGGDSARAITVEDISSQKNDFSAQEPESCFSTWQWNWLLTVPGGLCCGCEPMVLVIQPLSTYGYIYSGRKAVHASFNLETQCEKQLERYLQTFLNPFFPRATHRCSI